MNQRQLKVNSSNIKAATWNEDETLDVTFSGGGQYRYSNVTQEMADNLESAESAGSHFHGGIRKNCPCKKLG